MDQLAPPISRKSQTGTSLISLMLGVTLSIFGMLVTTSMHARHQAAVNSLEYSISHNRQLITALISIEKEVQSAGYGITMADQSNIITQTTPATATTPAGHSLLWRYVDNGTTVCRGLRERGFFEDGIEHRALILISSPTDCNTTTPLQNFLWDRLEGRLGQWEVRNELTDYINTNETLFTFNLTSATCSSPGQTQFGTHLIATVSAPNTAELNGNAIPANNVTACLLNIFPI